MFSPLNHLGRLLPLAFAAASLAPVTLAQAPEPHPPTEHREFATSQEAITVPPGAQPYSIGSPSAEEQLYLELINRARANPAAEGARLSSITDPRIRSAYNYFGVNTILMAQQFAAIPARPPLSMNARLLSAARGHSQDMYANNFQGHNGSNGSSLGSRANAQGYSWNALGENVFAYAESVEHGHAGFEVDWGGNGSNGGMQSPPGHRNNIHSGTYREVGIGVVLGRNGNVGPQIVTQDFGSSPSAGRFVTGVVYEDRNNNSFYDIGEGAGGVTVVVSGTNYYAISASSGGYSVPVPNTGSYTVTFGRPGSADVVKSATVPANGNAKVDYIVGAAATGPSFLANISTRSNIGTNDRVLIGGFIITGTQAKRVLVRGVGPSTSLPGALANPSLELHGGSGLLGSNDNWGSSTNRQEIINSTLSPANPNEPAILMNLAPGSYTTIMRGASSTTGVGLIEIYDLDRGPNSILANLSSRGFVQGDANVMIGGVIITGDVTKRILVRALGPSVNVAGALSDPRLELRNSNGDLLSSNDNWRSSQQNEIIATGVAPTNNAEAAIVATLSPASYTAIVRGTSGASGIALVEIYGLN